MRQITTQNDMTTKGKYNWINKLPRGTSSVIYTKLKKKVSIRTIQRILAGETEDNYGVIEIAARISAPVLNARKRGVRKISRLTRKTR